MAPNLKAARNEKLSLDLPFSESIWPVVRDVLRGA